jgi:8-oxo-dGTP diphosphatase
MKSEKSNRPHIAVRAIITNSEGKVLILKRAGTRHGNGKWCLPGGNVEYGQTINEAVVREIDQETSLTCKEFDFLFYLENLPSEESELHYINLAFKCNVEGSVKLNHESSDYAWIDSSDINNYLIAFRNDEILRRYWSLNTFYG